MKPDTAQSTAQVGQATATTDQTPLSFQEVKSLLERYQIQNSTQITIAGTDFCAFVVELTPSLAQQLLVQNTHNRKISKYNRRALTQEMIKGNWKFDGSPIRFDDEGNLIDGQHRLVSIVNSSTTQPTLVILGLANEVFKTIDTGKTRTANDILKIEDAPNANYTASILKFIYAFKNGKFSDNRSVRTGNLSNYELVEFYKEVNANGEFDELVSKAMSLYYKWDKFLTITVIGGLYFLINEKHPDKVDDFMNQLVSGINMQEKSPVLAIRKKILKTKTDKNFKMTQGELITNIVYIWKKWLDGKQVSKIVIPNDFEVAI